MAFQGVPATAIFCLFCSVILTMVVVALETIWDRDGDCVAVFKVVLGSNGSGGEV